MQEWPIPKKDAEAFLTQLMASTLKTVTTVTGGQLGGGEEHKSKKGGEKGGGQAGGEEWEGGLSLRNVVRSMCKGKCYLHRKLLFTQEIIIVDIGYYYLRRNLLFTQVRSKGFCWFSDMPSYSVFWSHAGVYK
jgi:hypothetical protein